MAKLSAVHGQVGWALMIFSSGKSAATSSMAMGWLYFNLMPMPPGVPAPAAAMPPWKRIGILSFAHSSHSG
jgi:hypothetical protein